MVGFKTDMWPAECDDVGKGSSFPFKESYQQKRLRVKHSSDICSLLQLESQVQEPGATFAMAGCMQIFKAVTAVVWHRISTV